MSFPAGWPHQLPRIDSPAMNCATLGTGPRADCRTTPCSRIQFTVVSVRSRSRSSTLVSVDGSPPRATQHVTHPITTRRGRANVTKYVAELVVTDADGVIRVDVLRQTVTHPTDLFLEGPEKPVPDDEDAAIILVEVLTIRAVVNPVV